MTAYHEAGQACARYDGTDGLGLGLGLEGRRERNTAAAATGWTGYRVTAEGAVTTAQRLGEMFRADRARIEPRGRRAGSALRVHEAIKARPITSMTEVCRATGLSFPAASSAMDVLVELGIARELTGRRRNRLLPATATLPS
jgi:hypothetical protein